MEQESVYSTGALTFALIACVLIIVAGVLGNLLTIAAIGLSPKLRRSPTAVFILSLCLFPWP